MLPVTYHSTILFISRMARLLLLSRTSSTVHVQNSLVVAFALSSIVASSLQRRTISNGANLSPGGEGSGWFLDVAGRQDCCDGALGALAIQSLQSYGESEPVYDNDACTIASVYHGGTLKLCTNHSMQPREPGSGPEYYVNQLRGWLLTDNLETFGQGPNAYRNSKNWAKEKRDELIEAANGRAADLHTATGTFGSSHAGVSKRTFPFHSSLLHVIFDF